MQGIGWGLNEEYFYDAQGTMRNSTFLDYRIPTCLDLPMIDTILVEVPNPDIRMEFAAWGKCRSSPSGGAGERDLSGGGSADGSVADVPAARVARDFEEREEVVSEWPRFGLDFLIQPNGQLANEEISAIFQVNSHVRNNIRGFQRFTATSPTGCRKLCEVVEDCVSQAGGIHLEISSTARGMRRGNTHLLGDEAGVL